MGAAIWRHEARQPNLNFCFFDRTNCARTRVSTNMRKPRTFGQRRKPDNGY
jgi:hypothetical protein